MGNEQSFIPGIDIVEKSVEVGDYWSQHSASIVDQENVTNLTVFIGESFVNGSLWTSQTPLEKNGKNLMIYRHPCIVKYISSWQKNSKFHLAVEEITPLSQEVPKLDNLQISAGLYSVLKALNFLHTKAAVSHNNICMSSIYISKDGTWKLAGMEYLCKYNDLTSDYLAKTKSSRYSKSVDPNEEKLLQNKLNRKDFIDVFAIGVLVGEIFKTKRDTPLLSLFLDFCKNSLQNTDISKRPTFKSILDHEFFNQEFIIIHSFLLELPLKNDSEKTEFFKNLADRLMEFDEEVVASQLSGLLLSRMVLLNKTAQNELLPFLLTPRVEEEEEEKSSSVFSETRFKQYICPKLLEIFKVRDVEIRLLLLNYLPKYMHMFTKEELQNRILPELLVGIKDTNDHLVSMTLKTLANLVSILGSATVIGGKRAKLFNDGRPTFPIRRTRNLREPPQVVTSQSIEVDQTSLSSLGTEHNNINDLPERPRPDGEEGETSTEEVEPSVDEDLDNWEDWELNEAQNTSHEVHVDEILTNSEMAPSSSPEVNITQHKSKLQIPDILELDIKSQMTAAVELENEFNFFQDMEPVIDSANKFVIDKNEIALEKSFSSKLAISATDDTNTGWEEEDWD